ncbi:MAG: hypothetical protein LBK59_02970, partial [Bifidobacteriaceae bacterium]|nr:hypothetical protein [Bifidobacteriaceae bacterium]
MTVSPDPIGGAVPASAGTGVGAAAPDAVARRAHAAFVAMDGLAPSVRAAALRAAARALDDHGGELIALAETETGLSA